MLDGRLFGEEMREKYGDKTCTHLKSFKLSSYGTLWPHITYISCGERNFFILLVTYDSITISLPFLWVPSARKKVNYSKEKNSIISRLILWGK